MEIKVFNFERSSCSLKQRARVIYLRDEDRCARERDARPFDCGLKITHTNPFSFVTPLVDSNRQNQFADLGIDGGLRQNRGGMTKGRARVAVDLKTR